MEELNDRRYWIDLMEAMAERWQEEEDWKSICNIEPEEPKKENEKEGRI